MPSHFGFVFSVIWTAALVCVTSGAPAKKTSILEKFVLEFGDCSILEYVALPVYRSDDGAIHDPKRDKEEYDLLSPLGVCTTDEGFVPLCNEAFEMIRNLSTCREDVDFVRKTLPSSFKPIDIPFEIDNVCEGLKKNSSILPEKEEFVAYKLTDSNVCSLICREQAARACSFLLWGYQVQALLNKALNTAISPSGTDPIAENVRNTGAPIDTSSKGNEEASDPTKLEKPLEGGGVELSVAPSEAAGPVSAQRNSDVSNDGNDGESLQDIQNETQDGKTSHLSLPLSTGGDESSQSKEGLKPNTKSVESNLPKTDVKEPLLPKSKPSETAMVVKTNVSPNKASVNTVTSGAASKTSTISHLLSIHSKQDNSDGEAKESPPIVSSGGNEKLHRSTTVDDKDMKPPSEKTNTGIIQETPSNVVRGKAEEDKKDESTPEPAANLPGKDDSDAPMLQTHNVPANRKADTEDSNNVENMPENDVVKNGDSMSVSVLEKQPKTGATEKSTSEKNPNSESVEKTKPLSSKKMGSSEAVSPKPISDGEDSDMEEAIPPLDDQSDPNGIRLGPSPNVNDNQDADVKEAADVSIGNDDKPKQKVDISADNSEKKDTIVVSSFPQQEDAHFFFYFVTIVIFAIGGYVLFHNKQKIFALIIEGRHERRRRSGASYRKLDTK